MQNKLLTILTSALLCAVLLLTGILTAVTLSRGPETAESPHMWSFDLDRIPGLTVHTENLPLSVSVTDGTVVSEPVPAGEVTGTFTDLKDDAEIRFPDSILSVELLEIRDCPDLKSVSVQGKTESIGKLQISGCPNLERIVLSFSTHSIREFEFHNCPSLTSLVVSDAMDQIGNFTFYDCAGLEKVVVDLDVESIGNFEFIHCPDLRAFAIEGQVGRIGNLQLWDCDASQDLSLFGQVGKINKLQIQNATALRQIFMMMDVGSMDSLKFDNCPALEAAFVTYLKEADRIEFSGCTGLKTLFLDSRAQFKEPIRFSGVENIRIYYRNPGEDAKDEARWYVADNGLTATVGPGETLTRQSAPNIGFSMVWGVYGKSSYDSRSGKLVKTTDTIERSPADYETTLILSDEQRAYISELLFDLDLSSYPSDYDPYRNDDGTEMTSSPSRTIVLRTSDGYTVVCRDICLAGIPNNEKGAKFIRTVEAIRGLLTSTEEWKALPEYEVFYE
ncbi:MAG: leucine-rich repeat protein [Clostridia bacterium]|nr:leucine-rich repeat protein [Clostridia bacterium]